MSKLARRKCVPCEGGVPRLRGAALAKIARELGGGWRVVRGHHLSKEWRSPDFTSALAFVNRIGALAEKVWHHPDVRLGWGRVQVEIFTHAIGGLSESDFVLAAKIDELASRAARRPMSRPARSKK
jgi:4a-hydroxytetrahydrobiopterin dehydratase